MVRVVTSKPINLSQLCCELGAVPLRHVEGEFVEADMIDSATLAAAVEAHVADPGWVNPAGQPAPLDPDAELRNAIEAATTLAQLKAALLGTGKPAQVAARVKG